MKLRIITGRAGAGKSKLVLETIAAQRFERPQILLVPEHATHEAELDLCRALGDTASRDGEVLSFQSLATRVLSQTGGISDITLDNGGKILIMRRALQEVSSYLTVFSKPSQRPAFLRELVALADELYAYKIAPSLLLQQVQDIPGAAGNFRQFPLLCGNQIVQSERLAFFDRGRIDTGNRLGIGNSQMYLVLNTKQDGGFQPLMLD